MGSDKRSPTGTREWAVANCNICIGCKHNCRYCYSRYDLMHRFHWTDDWLTLKLDLTKAEKFYRKKEGTIMFPSAHDITPEILDECVEVLGKMLEAGNDVLIVSKPHLECIKRICDDFGRYKKQILFRFTIGSMDDKVLAFWEPGAPNFKERLTCLKYAFYNGFETSVSSEPYLDGTIKELFHTLKFYVTNSIWIGPMNKMETRVDTKGWTEAEWEYWRVVKSVQTKEWIEALYNDLKKERKVKWKDAVKKILKLPIPKNCGMDI